MTHIPVFLSHFRPIYKIVFQVYHQVCHNSLLNLINSPMTGRGCRAVARLSTLSVHSAYLGWKLERHWFICSTSRTGRPCKDHPSPGQGSQSELLPMIQSVVPITQRCHVIAQAAYIVWVLILHCAQWPLTQKESSSTLLQVLFLILLGI